MSTRKNKYRVLYTVKSENGFLIEKSQQFPSYNDVRTFISVLQTGGHLVGKPIVEIG